MTTHSNTKLIHISQNDQLLKEATSLKGAKFDKFLSLLGMLCEGVNPYSKRFMAYWDKFPPKSHKLKIALSNTKRSTVAFNDAWKILTAYSFAAKFPSQWKEDIPALATHWLHDEEDVTAMLDAETKDRWHSIMLEISRSSDEIYSVSVPKGFYPLRCQKKIKFTFIDLFAGIGGFRIPLQEFGGRSVFSSEWDPKSRETYFVNYGEWPYGDITRYTNNGSLENFQNYIPSHDILTAGFPCQPFSHAGQKKGFEDVRGNLFFDILQIAKNRMPRVLFLENVKGLKGHDRGNTFKVICDSLYDLGYKVYTKVITARDFGVPQNRQRIFIVAFRDSIAFKFPDPKSDIGLCFGDILEDEPDPSFSITPRMWKGHIERKKRNKAKGKGFGYSLFSKDAQSVNTISARYWKDGSEILIDQPEKDTPRTLTPRECARLQGFPEKFILHKSKKSSYQQFGNAVAIPVISAIAFEILRALENNKEICNLGCPLLPVHY